MKEYKPIMVFYLNFRYNKGHKENWEEIEKIVEKSGYENFIMVYGDSEPRVEIISVDKATVVEDIQKYIDEKLEK